MHFLKSYRSGNTVRVTIPRALRHELNLYPGDLLRVKILRRGVAEFATLDPTGNLKLRQKV